MLLDSASAGFNVATPVGIALGSLFAVASVREVDAARAAARDAPGAAPARRPPRGHGRVGRPLAAASAALRPRAGPRRHVAADGRGGRGRGRPLRGRGGDVRTPVVAARGSAPGGDGGLDGPARRGDGRDRARPELALLLVGVAPAHAGGVRPRGLGCAAVVARGALCEPLHGRHPRRAARDDDPLRRPQGLHHLLRGPRPGRGDRDAQRLLHRGDPGRRQAPRRHDRPPHRRRDHGDLQPAR